MVALVKKLMNYDFDFFISKIINMEKALENDFEYDDANFGKPVLELDLFSFDILGTTDSYSCNSY